MSFDILSGIAEGDRRRIPDVDVVSSGDESASDAAAEDTAADDRDGTVSSGLNGHLCGDMG